MAEDIGDECRIEWEIRKALFRYCRSMDRIDAALGYTVWHEGGTADYGEIFKGTGHGFIDWVCEFHRGLDVTSHQFSNILVNVLGPAVAHSETYVTVALLGTESGRRKLTTGRGRYMDRWSLRDGRWALEHRDYVHDFAFTQELDDVMMGWGHRDLQDPSYDLLGAIGAA